ncbi:hypothetical protein A2U01_0009236 [Trifolium medium]|uniref:Uncharacterized protein n=1 Tax=Trifolium medium TaxID=97028 RepID=A0A392MLF0_9FABA|nr:hypothetical protein [Trifolium medium]
MLKRGITEVKETEHLTTNNQGVMRISTKGIIENHITNNQGTEKGRHTSSLKCSWLAK